MPESKEQNDNDSDANNNATTIGDVKDEFEDFWMVNLLFITTLD